ncbi:hypothetical protein [Nocardia arthritidis]|uniref:Uncharacterized protein n=1 Tax=Nocardia arthritidis TaxID=228602 RepID=A0A6G9YGW7_9NOCA|nr:hypothetical protein [Nocardia arthritidis]QIS12431.1 hypothetical protein F5544_22850 [Nocardia arthritidis]
MSIADKIERGVVVQARRQAATERLSLLDSGTAKLDRTRRCHGEFSRRFQQQRATSAAAYEKNRIDAFEPGITTISNSVAKRSVTTSLCAVSRQASAQQLYEQGV